MNPGTLRRLVLEAARKLSAERRRVLGALSILVALLGWALASPVGASPDENFHLASIWCSHGIRPGICEPGDTADTRRVPSQFPLDIVCFAGKPLESAACQTETPATGELADTDRGNFSDRSYPPVFYWVAGLFVGDAVSGTAVDGAVLVMRVVNAALYVALLTAVYLLLAPGLRRPMLAGALLTAVPLGVFLIPSVNPSGWAILSATTFLVSLLGYLTTEDRRRRIALAVLAAVSLFLGAGARSDAAAYAVVAIVAAVILTWRPGPGQLRRIAYPGVLALAATLAFLLTGQSDAADPTAAESSHSIGRLIRTAIDVPVLWLGAMGGPPPQRDFGANYPWGLGWLDTAMPAVVWVGLWGTYVAILFVALARGGRRLALAVAAVGGAVLLVPTYLQYLTGGLVGGQIQPRYVLPLLTLLAITAMVRLDGEAFRLTRGQRWIVVAVLAVANAAALYANVRRYTTGNAARDWNLDRAAEWWWSLPISPLTVCAITAIAFAAGTILLTAELTTPATASGAEDAPATRTGAAFAHGPAGTGSTGGVVRTALRRRLRPAGRHRRHPDPGRPSGAPR